ncbi:MAG: dipeptide epimerase [Bacteroidetes bacterium]|nr:MAG: dipeptide epimerase [Bacteroidota bacterium]
MKITGTEIYKLSIPMHPFTIATGTMNFAQNIFIRINTEKFTGVGECSAFPMIVGETQSTCFEMAKDFARIWKGQDAEDIEGRMKQLHDFTAYNSTIKSAFDMALYDLAAKKANVPLYQYLGASQKKPLETDITVGIDSPDAMAAKAMEFKSQGFRIIKVKLGKEAHEDIERIKKIREAIGDKLSLRIDANQGWDFDSAVHALRNLAQYHIQFCEQPMRRWNDPLLPELKKLSPIPIMADESVFDHHDAKRMIDSNSCSFINIKFAKSGGILEALKIHDVSKDAGIPCMMGGMLESRVALTAFAHFATACSDIVFYDMDTCMLGHKLDPVTGGVKYNGFHVELPDGAGIGADVDENYLSTLEKALI